MIKMRVFVFGIFCCTTALAKQSMSYESLVPDFEYHFEKKASNYAKYLAPKERELFLKSSKVNATTTQLLEAIKEPNGYAMTMELANKILRNGGFSENIVQLYYRIFVLMPRLGEFLNPKKSGEMRKALRETAQLFHRFSSADRRRLLDTNRDAVELMEEIFDLSSAVPDEILFEKMFTLLIRPIYQKEFYEKIVTPEIASRL